jgi:hypothetical protein
MAAEAPFLMLQRYARVGHEKPLYEALRGIPPDSLTVPAFSFENDAVEAFASPMFVPALLRMLGSPGEGGRIAATALVKLGPRAPKGVLDSLKRRFTALSALQRKDGNAESDLARLGAALTALGDSAALRWARAKLLDGTTPGPHDGSDLASAAEIAASARDRAGLNLMLANAAKASSGFSYYLVKSIGEYHDPRAWATLLEQTRSASAEMKMQVLTDIPAEAMRDSAAATRIRVVLAEFLANADDAGARAALAASKLGAIQLAPAIVELLRPGRTTQQHVATFAVMALKELTGAADAPTYAEGVWPPRSVYEWWKARVAAPAPRTNPIERILE